MEVLSGLNNACVKRLKSTWAGVSKGERDKGKGKRQGIDVFFFITTLQQKEKVFKGRLINTEESSHKVEREEITIIQHDLLGCNLK